MIIRGAAKRDFAAIDELLKDQGTSIDFSHLKMMIVAVDGDDEILAVGSLVTVLEASFLVDKSLSRKERVAALQLIIDHSIRDAQDVGYDRYYAFVQGGSLVKLLKRKFNFLYSKGVNMLRWV